MKDQQLQTIEFIRDIQVKKKRKTLRSAENKLKEVGAAMVNIEEDIKKSRVNFAVTKERELSRLFGKTFSIDKLEIIKRKEIENYHYIEQKKSEKDNLGNDWHDKKKKVEILMKELWGAEKMLIKIQEFVKLEKEKC
jgi:hypothetical protein